MSRRTLAYIGLALAILVGGRLLSTSSTPSSPSPEPEASIPAPTPFPSVAPHPATPLKRPASSMAEYGVLTDRPEADLEALIDRAALSAAIPPRLCGDDAACDAVRATLRDERATVLKVVASGDWSLEHLDVETAARNLSTKERAGVKSRARIVVVRVNAATSSKQLALRAAIAATAALAEKVDGLVWDQLLNRVQRSRDFAAQAVTTPLGTPVFRRDRIETLYEPKQEGIVRVLTSGLARWGVADIEAATVPTAATERVAEIVLGVAEAVANGATSDPITLTRDDLARARGKDYPADAGLPPPVAVDVDVVSVHPESGDPNDFIARVEPAAGDGPLAYLDLAERFFGPVLAASPGSEVLSARKGKAQRDLGSALGRWTAAKASGPRMLVQLPFPIPGEGGIESMWIDVTRFDARTITGKVLDEPLGATDVHRGDEVTRPRTDVEDLDLRIPTAP